jgi:hypothetical protein
MRTHRLLLAISLAGALATASASQATPTSTFWTPVGPDIQARGVIHLGVDNYFTAFRTADDGAGSFPTDFGLTVGLLSAARFQLEVGIDVVEASDDPVFLNLKMGSPEGAWFDGSPALQLGLANAGTDRDATGYDVFYLVIGRTIPRFGRLSLAPYVGNDELLRNPEGRKENSGWMVAFDRGFRPTTDAAGNTFNRWVLAADYATGDNALGGGGLGLAYSFTKDISLLTGPVWFNSEEINGPWKWTIQLDVNLPPLTR